MSNQPQGRFSEPDNRDWRGQSAQIAASGGERSWDNIRDNREFGLRFDAIQQDGNQFSWQDQLNSQFARAQISSNQTVITFREDYNFFLPLFEKICAVYVLKLYQLSRLVGSTYIYLSSQSRKCFGEVHDFVVE